GGWVALRGPAPPRPADVPQSHALGQRLLEPVPDRTPGAHGLRLLLRPDALLPPWKRPHELAVGVDGERIELLDPPDRDGVRLLAQLVSDEVVVDLPGADHEPAHPGGVRGRGVSH